MPRHSVDLASFGRWLIIDDDPLFRDLCTERLEAAGCRVTTVTSYAQALQVGATDEDVGLIVTDHRVERAFVEDFVALVRNVLPAVIIIGSSAQDCREEFSNLGVERFLRKPWKLEQLQALLVGRRTQCDRCGRRLALRLPLEGEDSSLFHCRSCGKQYHGVVDHDSPPEAFRNVQLS